MDDKKEKTPTEMTAQERYDHVRAKQEKSGKGIKVQDISPETEESNG